MIIKVKNNQHEEAPKTALSAPLSASGTTVTVKNINGFTDNWNVQIGEVGEEKTQIIEIEGAPSGSSILLAGTIKDPHPADTPVYCVKYNQIVFERSTDGTAGTATEVDDGTIGITADSMYTQWDDTSGSTSYAYKTKYRSTGLASNSSESDWIKPGGHDFYSLAKIRDRIKSKMINERVSDDQIDDWINEWMHEMNGVLIDVNKDYAIGTADVSFSGTSQYGTITSEDFKQIRRAWYTQDGSQWYKMTKQEYTDFSPETEYNETHPYYHMKGDSEIGRNPHEQGGTIRVSYYKLRPILDSDADLLPVPMREYTGSFVKWGLAQSYRTDKMVGEASQLENEAKADLEKFRKESTPRNKSGPSYISIVEGLGESSEGWTEW